MVTKSPANRTATSTIGATERGEHPAAVRHDQDEEDDHVGHALARSIGGQQRADQQHRRAGGADHVGQERSDPEQGGVLQRRSRQRAAHPAIR
jgi:hypothetical protein